MTTYELRASIAADLEQMSLEMLENVSRYVKRLRLHPNSAHVEEEDLTLLRNFWKGLKRGGERLHKETM